MLVKVNGVDPRSPKAVVEYVRHKEPDLKITQYEHPGWDCVFVCDGVDDIDAFAERLDLETTTPEKEKTLIGAAFDLTRVVAAAGPETATRFDTNSLQWALKDLESGDFTQDCVRCGGFSRNRLVTSWDVVTAGLVNLQSDDTEDTRRVCRLLKHTSPAPGRCEEVARALLAAAQHENESVRAAAAMDALAVWYTPGSLLGIIEQTKNERSHIARIAIRILGEIKTDEAIEAILDRFPDQPHDVIETLVAIGPYTERAILRRVDKPPMLNTSMTYALLGHVEIPKCMAKLEQVKSMRANLENQARLMAALKALGTWSQSPWIDGAAYTKGKRATSTVRT